MTTYDVLSFGAVADGTTLCTKALQSALDTCAAAGGGEVYFPAGRYLSGTLIVRSHTQVTLSPGTVLLGSPRLEDYWRDERVVLGDCTGYHLLYVMEAEQVTITGGGTIDGQGPYYWDSPERPMGEVILDGVNRKDLAPQLDEARRPQWRGYHLAYDQRNGRPSPMVVVYASKDVRIENLTLTQPAGWTLHLLNSERVWVRGINIANSMISPNSDGIDITSCRDVMISNCHIINGDDSIVFFSKAKYGPCERITVSNCILSSRTSAFNMHGGPGAVYRQIMLSNIVVYNSERALAMYLRGGGFAEDVLVSDFVIHTGCTVPNFSERPLHFDVARQVQQGPESEIISEERGHLRGVTLRNIIIRSPGRIILAAEPESPIENLTLSNITLQVSGPQDIPSFINPSPSLFQHNRTMPHIRTTQAHVILHGIKGLSVDNLNVVNASEQPLQGMHGLWLEHVEDSHIGCFRTYPLQDGYETIHAATHEPV